MNKVETCADSLMVKPSLFQESDGSSILTSAHQLLLEQIPLREAEAVYEKWHYLGKQKLLSTYNFGIYFNRGLLGCISFGSPNAKVY